MMSRGMKPYLFVDDILMMGDQERGIDKFEEAAEETLEYLKMGGQRYRLPNRICLLPKWMTEQGSGKGSGV